MNFLQTHIKKIAIIGIIVITSGVVVITAVVLNSTPAGISVRLLNNAGVMIEAEDTRIYIDPYDLPSRYSSYPADAVLITHDHGDHYDITAIDIIKTDDTNFYFPAIMGSEYSLHDPTIFYDGDLVNPEDTFTVNNFSVRCFYMYTDPGSDQSGHPQSSNYTSYIIDIDGFTIFHAGDSWNIDEYEQLTGEVDLVLLPIGPGCQAMTDVDIVSVIEVIAPSYFIPIHFTDEGKESFIELYRDSVEDLGCELIDLDYYDSYKFNPP
ncbi:MAG: MBL fold metallo-hydrolase [Candidatus Hodarchaeales archaeon]|jgi:L-ascorbate metabolism protein UlaG (beta-lactamase superfamily)